MSITTRAAVARAPHRPWEITELQLDEPKAHEVRVKFHAAGLCHSDDHITNGDAPVRLPIVGGHEGAGVVESVGPHVTRVKPGDRIVCSYIPACGKCRPCSTGHQNMCDEGKNASTGMFADGTFRFHADGEDFGGFCTLGTFSQYAVVSEWACLRLPDDIPFEIAALVGCGVPTGWGSAVYAAGVRAGETVVIYGAGGVGSNAVQGARYAGAKNVVVVDPVEFKRDMAKVFGATHTFATAKEAHDFVVETTWGQLADHAICTPGVLTEEIVNAAVRVTGKGGKVTVTAVGKIDERAVHFPAGMLIGYQRQLRGALFGDSNPLYDVPRLLGLYRSGDLKLDELITRRYTLDQVNDGYQDMLDGKNIRGVIVHEH
ncbi:NDMA-dependent alcohol dehydrogenase [Amycolatopsis methanolica]|uniref:Putative zinc-containing alcohol dehydrogenase n=1 Tax=Amycolatopsis methanolica 239 TaxID=1068978 RepID=A0A076MS08_AMYME|nr:NDMA-dependent alcohol dehydrogenase [Amycolatopsis methanolica]AIJ23459.1 putative zinc-containing alcohol dehydrogenase [Amycolatopsis methanolica 239]